MSLPTTFTTYSDNAGTLDSTIWSAHRETATTQSYIAPSPQGDLAGRGLTKITQNPATKNGVVVSKLVMDFPTYDATDESYKGFEGVDIIMRRKDIVSTDDYLKTVEHALHALNALKDGLVTGAL